MCFSFRTSIISYTLGISSSIFALLTRQFVLGSLIFSYAQMQLSEAMIWHGIDTKNLELNKRGTAFGKYLLATHNFAIGLGIILSIILISKRKIKIIDFIPIILGILFFLYIVFYYYIPKKYPDVTFPLKDSCKSCQNPNNRLQWSYPHKWYNQSFLLSVIICLIWIKPNKSKTLFLVFFTISFMLAYYTHPKTVGSIWCWSTSFLAPLIVLINYYMIRNTDSKLLLT